MFLQGLAVSGDAIGQMALLVAAGYVAVKRGWLSSNTLGDLTGLLIDLVIPCAFILSLARSFSPALLLQGSALAALSAGWILLSWAGGAAFFRIFPGDSRKRDRSVTAMMMISNSLYLPLPVILAVTPPEAHDEAVVYISMVSMPSIVIMWTLGVRLLASGNDPAGRERLKRIFNPPILAFAAGVALSFVPGVRESARNEPGGIVVVSTVFRAMEYVSALLSPLAMLVLGGMIAAGASRGRPRLRYLAPLMLVRLVIVPAAAALFITLAFRRIDPLAAAVLLLVAAAPPATNHALIARRYHGEWELVSSLQLATHLAALVTLPLWLTFALSM